MKEIAKKSMASHGQGIGLLRDLANGANAELFILNGTILEDPALRFRLLILTQAINTAWNMVDLIEAGSIRSALVLARVLRETHIAVLWSIGNDDLVRSAYASVTESGSVERGGWPESGEMARQVTEILEAEGSSAVKDWDSVMRTFGDTHNQLFSHALSDFSLTTGLDPGDERFTPIVGPIYSPVLLGIAIDHCVPLFVLMLGDAASLVARHLQRKISPEAEPLLVKGGEWWKANPPPVLRKLGTAADETNRA